MDSSSFVTSNKRSNNLVRFYIHNIWNATYLDSWIIEKSLKGKEKENLKNYRKNFGKI